MNRTIGQRQRLENDLVAVEEELQRLDRGLLHRPEFGLGQGSARADAWQVALQRRQRAQTRRERLHAALDRLAAGVYGRCERCGQPIHPERLEILPAATLCVSCARGCSVASRGAAADASGCRPGASE